MSATTATAPPQPRLVSGHKAIARALGRAPRKQSIIKLARRAYEPLRLRQNLISGKVYQWTDRLADWARREEARRARLGYDPSIPRVVGLGAIRALLGGVSRRVVYAYAARQHDPLPLQGVGTRKPWIYRCALRDWMEAQDAPWTVGKEKIVAADKHAA